MITEVQIPTKNLPPGRLPTCKIDHEMTLLEFWLCGTWQYGRRHERAAWNELTADFVTAVRFYVCFSLVVCWWLYWFGWSIWRLIPSVHDRMCYFLYLSCSAGLGSHATTRSACSAA